MNCQECKEHLVEYIEELLEDQQAGAIESHLADCPTCRAEAAQLKKPTANKKMTVILLDLSIIVLLSEIS